MPCSSSFGCCKEVQTMKKKSFALLLTLALCLVFACTAFAAPSRLVDDADLLTPDEEASLLAKLDEISTRQGLDVVVVTTPGLGGASPVAFADDYYDYNGYANDGILLLVSMEERDWYMSTKGFGITAFTDAGLEYIAEEVLYYLSDGYYALAFESFADQCDRFITQAKTSRPFDVGNMPREPFSPVISLFMALVPAFIIAFIATAIMRSKLKTVHRRHEASDYMKPGSFRLFESCDLYLYSTVSRQKKEPPKSSGGGSSVHRSSSGAFHGGRGGKF